MKNNKQKYIPELRFPEFENDMGWEVKTIDKACDKPFSGGTPSSTNRKYYGGEIPFIRSAEINKEATELFLTKLGFENSSAKMVREGDILVALYGANSGDVGVSKINGAINQAILCLRSKTNNSFLYQYLVYKKNWIISTYLQGGQGNLSGDIIKSIELLFPKPKEQEKIANCLSSLDNLITSETEKLNHIEEHKKGLLQQLFPTNGETQPQYRFPEFKNDEEWKSRSLKDCLDYLQPTPYLVDSTDYDDSYETPVLTAGKTFVLGYTDEGKGVFNENLPVIIFDDFTTATKYVDFPFKAKSSAMKILLVKNKNNIKFIFEAIQNIKFEVSAHQRHWISIYSKLEIFVPKPQEQQKIAQCLLSVDNLIALQSKKINDLKKHKEGLMQKMFPIVNNKAI